MARAYVLNEGVYTKESFANYGARQNPMLREIFGR